MYIYTGCNDSIATDNSNGPISVLLSQYCSAYRFICSWKVSSWSHVQFIMGTLENYIFTLVSLKPSGFIIVCICVSVCVCVNHYPVHEITYHLITKFGPGQNWQHFTDDTFKCIFFKENVRISTKISLKFVLRVQLTIFQHWFSEWLGADQATSHYLNQWWLDYRCIYTSLGLNELCNDLDLQDWIFLNVWFLHQCE